MKTYVYIDGFNFYYGAVKDTPYKWLDLQALSQRLFPKNQIARVKYFTARVWATPSDPTKPQRQDIYFRALVHHIPGIEIVEGRFLKSRARMRLASSGEMVLVNRMEEKGSDVNLAVHLLNDAWKNRYQAAIVISNDSDLAEAIRLVKEERKKPVGIVNPQMKKKKKMAIQLNKVASFRKRITVADLKACQLPHAIPGSILTKPGSW